MIQLIQDLPNKDILIFLFFLRETDCSKKHEEKKTAYFLPHLTISIPFPWPQDLFDSEERFNNNLQL